jgi:hypothetical protein
MNANVIPKKILIRIRDKWRSFKSSSYPEVSERVNLTTSLLEKQINSSISRSGVQAVMPFQVLIVSSISDQRFLPLNIRRLFEIYGDSITNVTVLTPNVKTEIVTRIRSFKSVVVEHEEIYIGESLSKTIQKFKRDRHSWLKQQYLKSKFVYDARVPVLILDADTFINKRINWSPGSKLLLINSADFHYPYNLHYEAFSSHYAPLLNFVCHVQLQEPSIIKEMFGADFELGWRNWLLSGYKKYESSPVSEYQSYGSYICNKFPNEVSFFIPKHLLLFPSAILDSSFKNVLVSSNSDILTLGNKNDFPAFLFE